MYQTFRVQNFRGFEDLEVTGLKAVNLIAGGNNVGKTSLLEALFLHLGCFNPSLVLAVADLRGMDQWKREGGGAVDPPWRWLFRDADESFSITLSGSGEPNVTRVVEIATLQSGGSGTNGRSLTEQILRGVAASSTAKSKRAGFVYRYSDSTSSGQFDAHLESGVLKMTPSEMPPPPLDGIYLTARWKPDFAQDAELFGELAVVSRSAELIEVLRVLEPRLKDLSTVSVAGSPMLHADIGLGRLLPIAFLGDGVLRATRYVLNILHSANGVVLIDEIENGLHHSVLRSVWEALGKAAAMANVQVFATTHSRECLVAAHEAFSSGFEYDFSLQRLQRDRDGAVQAVAYDKETLEASLQAGFEVR
jgi:hypothetical protein